MNHQKLSPTCKAVALCCVLLFCTASAAAQFTEATLKGAVSDSTGNALVQIALTATHEQTGLQRAATTDNKGSFLLAGLPPGIYTVQVRAAGFKSYEQRGLKLNVGQTTELVLKLEVGDLAEAITINAKPEAVVATEGRLSDNFSNQQLTTLPLPQRDVFLLPKLSAGATQILGSANSTKLTNSPVVTVNGNRYRGNNYVLDGALNTNPNNTGEPTLVPALESLEEVQVQTGNFSSEYGRGNGAVINLQTKAGTNQLHGKLWEYHRNAALNARNFFSAAVLPQVFNQFGGNVGGPVFKNRTFFFGSYEGTRNAVGRPLSFLVETPQLRDYVIRTAPTGVAARLFKQFPAPTPVATGCATVAEQRNCLSTAQGFIPAIALAAATLRDYVRFDQYLARLDHSFNNGADKVTARWISENQRDQGGTSSSRATLGKALRGSRGPFDGFFANLNLGYVHVFQRAVNDARFSFQNVDTTRGNADAAVPDITITGIEMPFGDIFNSRTKLRTYEIRDTLTLDRGKQTWRAGFELRRAFKGLSLGPATAGAFSFRSIADFVADRPFRQTLTVDPATGKPAGFPRYFTQYEAGAFFQNDWKVTGRLNLNLGLRYDYFGDVTEREGRLSSIILGTGNNFNERLANAALGRVDRLYTPQRRNFAPRIGLAYDPFGNRKTAIRAGFSLAFQPHHGQSIAGARALPPDAIQGVIQPSNKIGTQILYNIPVPFNAEFARGLNAKGGVNTPAGENAIRITGFVVNPTIKTQYSENWFLNLQREFAGGWIVEAGYVGTNGINLERIDDVNRFAGDLADGKEDRLNPNFGVLLFVTNGVTSSYHAFTAELRRAFAQTRLGGFALQTNYRWSKWLDTASDTSTGQFTDNSEPGKGAQDAACLRCERARSLFDIPQRLSTVVSWTPAVPMIFDTTPRWLGALSRDWLLSGVLSAQSGRPFSVWNGAPSNLVNGRNTGGDYNLDGGGGAVGGWFYDRPNAPAPGTLKTSFSQRDFLKGLFDAGIFPAPALGQNGTLGRNTFRGPRAVTLDLSVARSFTVWGERQLQIRLEAFNALNNVNLFLPNADLSLASFGKSTQAHDARTLQAGLRFTF
ncbi:MAG: TonB-dependent receptor [Acidobacteria bacterium]|nr:TonB-dependent receptor [Acidobacteriota bacterium]